MKFNHNKRNSKKNKCIEGKMLFILILFEICLCFSQNPMISLKSENVSEINPNFAQIEPNAAAEKSIDPNYLQIQPSYSNFLQLEFGDKLIKILNISGGFPNEGSDIMSSYYALKTLELTGNLTSISLKDMENFILSKFNLTYGNFIEDEINKMEYFYYAIQVLDFINASVPLTVSNYLSDFIQNCTINQTLFIDYLGSNTTSPKITYQALYLLNSLNLTISNYINDTNRIFLNVLQNYYNPKVNQQNYGLFGKIDSEIFETTYYSHKIFEILNTINTKSLSMTEFMVDVKQGNIIKGNNESLYNYDEDKLKIQSQSGEINLSIKVPTDLYLQLENTGEFIFGLNLNISSQLDGAGNISIWNSINSNWDNLTSSDYLTDKMNPAQINTINTGQINYTDNILTANLNEPFSQYFLIQFSLTNTTDFQLDFNQFYYNYRIFDSALSVNQTNQKFDSICFDYSSNSENYHAAKILNDLNALELLTEKEWERLYNYTEIFKSNNSGYAIEDTSRFDSMMGTYFESFIFSIHAKSIELIPAEISPLLIPEYLKLFPNAEDATNNTITRHNNQVTNYVLGWNFPDGGFGTYDSLSLKATYRAILFLNVTGQLTSDISTKVKAYADSCINDISFYYDDLDKELSGFGDTYYAVLILEIVDPYFKILDINPTISNIISTQDPNGYFTADSSLKITNYAVSLIHLANRINDITYITQLNGYVSGLQLYYGGFLMSPYETEASVMATCYAVDIAKHLDILENIRMIEEDKKLGVLDYMVNHQDTQQGGFYEEEMGLLEEESKSASIETTLKICQTLSFHRDFNIINGTGLTTYLVAKIQDFNTFAQDNNISIEFSEKMNKYCSVYEIYHNLNTNGLRLEVLVAKSLVFPNKNVDLKVKITNPSGILIENCSISIIQGKVSYSLNDQQNGSYTTTLLSYSKSGIYPIRIQCEHTEYFSLELDYALVIYDPLDMDKLNAIKEQTLWFKNSFELKIPVFNKTSNKFSPNCNITLYDENNDLIQVLSINSQEQHYECTIEVDQWAISTLNYEVHIEGDGFLTTIIPVKVTVIPLNFLFILIVTIIGLIIVAFMVSERLKTTTGKTVKGVDFRLKEIVGKIKKHFSAADETIAIDIENLSESEKRDLELLKSDKKSKFLSKNDGTKLSSKQIDLKNQKGQKINEYDLLKLNQNLRNELGKEIYSQFADFGLKERIRILTSIKEIKSRLEQDFIEKEAQKTSSKSKSIRDIVKIRKLTQPKSKITQKKTNPKMNNRKISKPKKNTQNKTSSQKKSGKSKSTTKKSNRRTKK
jgi:hypothetical protein